MILTFDAIIENGTLKLPQPLDLPEGTPVRLTIARLDESNEDPLADVIGICDIGPDISLADCHDQLLYGLRSAEGQSP